MPGSGTGPKIPGIDKIVHFILYFIFTSLFFTYLLIKPNLPNIAKSMILCISIGTMYGVIIEIIQYYIPYRSFEFLDILANFAGANAGTFFIFFFAQYKITNIKQ